MTEPNAQPSLAPQPPPEPAARQAQAEPEPEPPRPKGNAMTTPQTPRERESTLDKARQAARNATFTLARDAGAQIITRPMFRDSDLTTTDVEPLPGMRAARDLELGARHAAHGYIRQAREAGRTWHDIGLALGLVPGGDAQQAGETIAEAAYTYAAGHPGTETARRYGRSFDWTCRSCDKTISDHGLISGPADDEHGHAKNCLRLAAAIARWDAQWEAEP
jgi:hypothetical protein